jgi:hypothetical protein
MLDAKAILDWITLTPKQSFIIFIITSILLFGGDQLITKLGLEKPIDYFQPWLGLIWLISIALILSNAFVPFYNGCIKKYKQRKYLKRCQKYLHDLTVDEKGLLREYIDNDTKTITAQLADGVVQELVTSDVIRLASSLSQHGDYFAYNIQPWAWRYLHENQYLLD